MEKPMALAKLVAAPHTGKGRARFPGGWLCAGPLLKTGK